MKTWRMHGKGRRRSRPKRLVTRVTALSLAVWPAMASAEPPPILIFDGYALREACADDAAYYTYGKCAGYIIAAHDAYVLARGSIDADICFSLEDGGAPEAMIAPVVDYLANDTTQLFGPASSLVVSALKSAFPCTD